LGAVKRGILVAALLAAQAAAGQYQENPFEEAFNGMFQIEHPDWEAITSSAEPPGPPDVPLDGGLVALLGAGAAVGYRKFRSRRA
jgi:MYXO-CTERM domain-containing protein